MATVVQENRPYQRILPSDNSIDVLQSQGFEWVFSSNVSAATTRGNNLIIRFHNGSLYSYKGQAKLYENLMAAASKGKWVWRFLRRPGVPYAKIGTLPLPEDTIETDEEIMKPRIATYAVKAVTPSLAEQMKGILPSISIMQIATVTATNNTFANIITAGIIGNIF